MSKKRRNGLDRMLERFAANLLYEATGGSIGVKPRAPKVVAATDATSKPPPTLQEKRAILDSLIKLKALDEKYRDDDDSGSGLAAMKRQLNGSGNVVPGGTATETESGSDESESAEY